MHSKLRIRQMTTKANIKNTLTNGLIKNVLTYSLEIGKVLKMANENDQQNIAFDFDIHKSESLQDLGFTCFILSSQYALLYDKIKVKKDGMADKDDNEAITVLFMVDDEISEGHVKQLAIGQPNWNIKREAKIKKRNNSKRQSRKNMSPMLI